MRKVNIISHRGANGYAPQNTLPAFEKSVELNADGTETDVHLTKDGYVVICHNPTVDEMSNGTGKIVDYTFEDIRKLDFGKKFGDEFEGTPLPTLDEYLECMKNADCIKIINVEIKPNKNERQELVSKTIEAAKRHGVFDKLLISSFDYKMLKEVKRVDSSCKTAYLYPTYKSTILLWGFFSFTLAKIIKCDAIHPHKSFISKRTTTRAHKKGMTVNVWTVNEEKDIIELVEKGVDGLITDCPDYVREVIEKHYK